MTAYEEPSWGMAEELRHCADYMDGTWRQGTELVPLADFTRQRVAAALREAAERLSEPQPDEPVMLEALHVSPATWDLFRAGVLRTFPGLDIVRLPDSEPGIRSWGITPKDLTIPQFNSDTPNTN